jgi:hypothetical protein
MAFCSPTTSASLATATEPTPPTRFLCYVGQRLAAADKRQGESEWKGRSRMQPVSTQSLHPCCGKKVQQHNNMLTAYNTADKLISPYAEVKCAGCAAKLLWCHTTDHDSPRGPLPLPPPPHPHTHTTTAPTKASHRMQR